MAAPSLKDRKKDAAAQARLIESGLRTLDIEAGGIGELASALRDGLGEAFTTTVDIIRNSKGRLIVTGMGKSGHIGRKIAATFASTGTPAFFVHPGEASHGDLGMITAGDVIIALSWSGETAELKNLLDYSRRFRIPLVALTAHARSTLAQAADVTLLLPRAREACPHNLAPTTSSLMQLALGDALAVALLESRGFTEHDFHVFHPGGRLGAMMKFVRDVMRTGDAVPFTFLESPMIDAIFEISAKSVGCVGITDAGGQLIGIITDGDLRRHLRPGLIEAQITDIMTVGPKTCRPDQLVSEVIETLNSANITAVFIVDGTKPVGVVHLHDLLRIGAA